MSRCEAEWLLDEIKVNRIKHGASIAPSSASYLSSLDSRAEQLAMLGDPKAMRQAATMMSSSYGMKQDVEDAHKWWHRAW